MEIEWLERGQRFSEIKPPQWLTIPCIGLGKTTVSINQCAVRTFSMRDGDVFLLGLAGNKFIIKSPIGDAENRMAYPLRKMKDSSRRPGNTLYFANKRFAQRIIAAGAGSGVYEIRLNSTQKLFEVDLSSPITWPTK